MKYMNLLGMGENWMLYKSGMYMYLQQQLKRGDLGVETAKEWKF